MTDLEFMIGATKVIIHDDDCVSEKETDQILNGVAKAVQSGLRQKETRKNPTAPPL